jgi:hypothetical protein
MGLNGMDSEGVQGPVLGWLKLGNGIYNWVNARR